MRPVDVAKFMIAEMDGKRALYKNVIAEQIEQRFGSEFSRQDTQGRWVIAVEVRREFESLGAGRIEWDNKLRAWRSNAG